MAAGGGLPLPACKAQGSPSTQLKGAKTPPPQHLRQCALKPLPKQWPRRASPSTGGAGTSSTRAVPTCATERCAIKASVSDKAYALCWPTTAAARGRTACLVTPARRRRRPWQSCRHVPNAAAPCPDWHSIACHAENQSSFPALFLGDANAWCWIPALRPRRLSGTTDSITRELVGLTQRESRSRGFHASTDLAVAPPPSPPLLLGAPRRLLACRVHALLCCVEGVRRARRQRRCRAAWYRRVCWADSEGRRPARGGCLSAWALGSTAQPTFSRAVEPKPPTEAVMRGSPAARPVGPECRTRRFNSTVGDDAQCSGAGLADVLRRVARR
eukprot:357723-Chlamydomonas_euryale.AAC.32